MHITYLDEAGTHAEARYFVVAGLSVFERETYFLAQNLDKLQAAYFPTLTEPLEFHARELHAPKEYLKAPWNMLTTDQRFKLLDEIYELIVRSHTRVFAIAMEKSFVAGDCYERGFEEIVNRFDLMLQRILRDEGQPQRGLIVLAESSYRQNLELLARRIATQGHRWGETYNMADIPYFAPAKSTRLLQLADFVANAVFGRYERGYTRHFDKIATRLDQEGGHIHGLVHLARDRASCYCPACIQRRVRGVPSRAGEEPNDLN